MAKDKDNDVFSKAENAPKEAKPFDWESPENIAQIVCVGYLLNRGNRKNIDNWFRGITKEHFLEPELGLMFEIIIKLNDSGYSVEEEFLFLKAVQVEMNKVYADYSFAILMKLSSMTAAVIDPRHYKNQLIDSFRKRTLRSIATAETEQEIDALYFKAKQVVQVEDDITSLHDVSKVVYEKAKTETLVHSTGLRPLDDVMKGGLHAGRSYCIAARPAQGKTTLLGTIAYHLNKAGVPTLFMATEMGKNQIAKRLLAHELKCYESDFNSLKNQFLWEKALNYITTAPNNIYFYDCPFVTIDQICAKVRMAHKKYGIKGFFFDYVGTQTIGGKDARTSETEHLGLVTLKIAHLCMELDIWCLYSAHTNREGHLYGSDGGLKSADQVYFQEKTGEKDIDGCETVWLKMEKTRYTAAQNVGSKETPLLRFNKFRPFIEEIPQ